MGRLEWQLWSRGSVLYSLKLHEERQQRAEEAVNHGATASEIQ